MVGARFPSSPTLSGNAGRSAQESAVLLLVLDELAAANGQIDAMIDHEIARSNNLENLGRLRAARAAVAQAMDFTRERLAI